MSIIAVTCTRTGRTILAYEELVCFYIYAILFYYLMSCYLVIDPHDKDVVAVLFFIQILTLTSLKKALTGWQMATLLLS